jgi:hypothetical protein
MKVKSIKKVIFKVSNKYLIKLFAIKKKAHKNVRVGAGAVIKIYSSAEPKEAFTSPQHCIVNTLN